MQEKRNNTAWNVLACVALVCLWTACTTMDNDTYGMEDGAQPGSVVWAKGTWMVNDEVAESSLFRLNADNSACVSSLPVTSLAANLMKKETGTKPTIEALLPEDCAHTFYLTEEGFSEQNVYYLVKGGRQVTMLTINGVQYEQSLSLDVGMCIVNREKHTVILKLDVVRQKLTGPDAAFEADDDTPSTITYRATY